MLMLRLNTLDVNIRSIRGCMHAKSKDKNTLSPNSNHATKFLNATQQRSDQANKRWQEATKQNVYTCTYYVTFTQTLNPHY